MFKSRAKKWKRYLTHSLSKNILYLASIFMLVVIIVLLLISNTLEKNYAPSTSPTPTYVANVQKTPVPTLATNSVPVYDSKRNLIALGDGLDDSQIAYYQMGTVQSGKYQGYQRIIAIESGVNQRGWEEKIFATNDNNTYILNGDPNNIKSYPIGSGYEYNNTYYGLNKSKITAVDNIDNFPTIILLDNNFALYKVDLYTNFSDNNFTLITDFSNLTNLSSNNKDYSFYYQKASIKDISQNYDPSSEKNTNQQVENQYLDSTSSNIIVVDHQGLAFTYNLTTPSRASEYLKQLTQLNNNSKPEYPTTKLGLGFKSSDVISDISLYNDYDGGPFSDPCTNQTFVVKNISDNDLMKVGTINNENLFALTNQNNPLYQVMYNFKNSEEFSSSAGFYYAAKPNPNKPTLSQYISKPPLLFIKDSWGRTIAFGEEYYEFNWGCGKPVVYLYPTTPTKVSVQFTTPMDLTTDIPTYHNGWNVLANPDGLLTDLQPEYTICSLINSIQFGSEYAKEACQNNQYPYLYWAGKSEINSYPKENDGWIITKDDLSSFMDKKLSEVGLNDTEKSDMLSYWIPEMLSKNAPFYKISFLQTAQMNELAPMTIYPRPNTLFRIFLDWSPLSSKPSTSLVPEKLNKLQRNGFTVVEWGGLKL